MTRRKLLHNLLGSVIAITLGMKWLIKKASPRKFVRALSIKKYPGSIKHIGDVCSQSKWNG
jgi:hypothetical protein